MPVVLQQHFLSAERAYEDVEEVLYHYPRQYFSRVRPFEPFVYYRPLGRGTVRNDSRHYFGHGILGEPWPDARDEYLRFVPVVQYQPFGTIVPLRDPLGNYYETGTPAVPQAQSAVRSISEIAYHRILAAADVAVTGLSALPSTAIIEREPYAYPPLSWPKDDLRMIDAVPPGAGYIPRASGPPNVYEAAALQERARADHQRVLAEIVTKVIGRGGTCWYNNNIDLLTRVGAERLLVEAKSLNDLRDAVHRMRYGLGQLLDYRTRYRAEIEGARLVLAFGRSPDRETSWIANILDENDVAFVSLIGDRVVPVNEAARTTQLFAG